MDQSNSGQANNINQFDAARVCTALPVAYRLVMEEDGNGSQVPVLEGLFAWRQGHHAGGHWQRLETQVEPYTQDDIPFGPIS